MDVRGTRSPGRWLASGEPWIWMNAAAVGLSIAAVCGILLLILVRGVALFWPGDVFAISDASGQTILGERVDHETLNRAQFLDSGGDPEALGERLEVERILIKTGNRRTEPPDFRWRNLHEITRIERPPWATVFERTEWGNAYGRLIEVRADDMPTGVEPWQRLQDVLARSAALRARIDAIEKGELSHINRLLERLRLERRRAELGRAERDPGLIEQEQQRIEARFAALEDELRLLRSRLAAGQIVIRTASGRDLELSAGDVIRAWQPNRMSTLDKLAHALHSAWLFLSENPREANTEGGVFPAIFGTVMMVLLMSLLVTPFGIVAAVYLREYARQGLFVRIIRIAVNNLAGVPSIVYGVFGLGFFVYFLGGAIDQLFFPAALPAPTFGTPGLLWASLTLALLTVPVVIVSTEEGLTRIPRELREGSLALGATKAETLFRVVLPMATPSILTGVILAVARAAGEVAPLMLVGVVKLAPTLPVDGEFPFLHLERKFMHLGFHIYDVGFQSPNVEAARPLVYATALLLVVIIVVLNLTAIVLRNRLERQYRGV